MAPGAATGLPLHERDRHHRVLARPAERDLRGVDRGERILLRGGLLGAVRDVRHEHVGGRRIRPLGGTFWRACDVHGGRPVEEAGVAVDHAEGEPVLAPGDEDRARQAHLRAAADLVRQRLQRLAARGGEVVGRGGERGPDLLLQAAARRDLGDGVLGHAAAAASAAGHERRGGGECGDDRAGAHPAAARAGGGAGGQGQTALGHGRAQDRVVILKSREGFRRPKRNHGSGRVRSNRCASPSSPLTRGRIRAVSRATSRPSRRHSPPRATTCASWHRSTTTTAARRCCTAARARSRGRSRTGSSRSGRRSAGPSNGAVSNLSAHALRDRDAAARAARRPLRRRPSARAGRAGGGLGRADLDAARRSSAPSTATRRAPRPTWSRR